jgi:hypothetical protein
MKIEKHIALGAMREDQTKYEKTASPAYEQAHAAMLAAGTRISPKHCVPEMFSVKSAAEQIGSGFTCVVNLSFTKNSSILLQEGKKMQYLAQMELIIKVEVEHCACIDAKCES